MEMVKVKTSDEKYAFKIQGKMVTSEKYQRVNKDHNVQCKLNENVLEEEKKEIKKEEKKKRVFTPAPAMSENNGRK
jgi:hypothetical protein